MLTLDSGLTVFLTHSLGPFLLTVAGISLLRRQAFQWGLVDKPGGRKQHDGATPLVGGIAMAAVYILTMLVISPLSNHEGLLFGLMILVVLGVVDDFRNLSARNKLIWQMLAAAAIIMPNADYVYHIGNLWGTGRVELEWLALPFTLVAVLGLVNAVNMADGIDGLAGSLVSTSTLWMAGLAWAAGYYGLALELLILLAVISGFLLFNLRTPLRKKASVFMGDAGSMMLGACLAAYAISLSQLPGHSVEPPPPIVILWVLGLPVLDTLVLTLRRLCQGRSPFSAGRDHMHHIWVRAGFTIGQSTVCLVFGNFMLGAIGVLGWKLGVPEWVLAAGYVGVLLFHCQLAHHAWVVSKWLRVHKATN